MFTTNAFGELLLDLCKTTGLRIANGRLYNDKNIGKFTYYKHNGKSVVDYLICRDSMLDMICDFCIGDITECSSDHVDVSFVLTTRERCIEQIHRSEHHLSYKPSDYKYIWKRELAPLYHDGLSREESIFTQILNFKRDRIF